VGFFESEQILEDVIADEINSVFESAEVGGAAAQEEVPLRDADLVDAAQDASGIQERVQQLVALEQTTANTEVEGASLVFDQDGETLFELVGFLGLLEAVNEELGEEVERVLVHGVNVGEVSNDEVQDGASQRDGAVRLTGSVNHLGGLLSLNHTLVNRNRSFLRLVEGNNELLIVQNVV
jgi:hypothetical protein